MLTVDKTSLVKEIIELQRQVNRVLRQYAPDAWMELNLTIPQLKSLIFIVDIGSTNFKKLADVLGVTPPNVTGIVDRLVEQGLVNRQENPEDRRMLTLRATEKGEALIADLRERYIRHMSEVLTRLSVPELTHVKQGLVLLVTAAESEKREFKDELKSNI